MNKFVFAGCVMFSLLSILAVSVCADIIILKNGQVINDVSIKDEGDTLYCESNDQSFYINKNTVENIIRTGPRTVEEKTRDFITSLPRKTRLFVKDYFAFVAVVVCIMLLLAALIIFKILWMNLTPIIKSGARRRDIKRAVKSLDADEKSVLREFYIQAANSLEMPVEDMVVSGLIKKGILETTRDKGQYSAGGLMLPVIISPTAKKYTNPRKVEMPANLNDPEIREALARTRPQYMYEMAGFYKSLEEENKSGR